jgi:hypothetical protein
MIPSAVESDHHVAATDGSMVVGSTGAERRKEVHEVSLLLLVRTKKLLAVIRD